jgi:Rad3-related DNA helicase
MVVFFPSFGYMAEVRLPFPFSTISCTLIFKIEAQIPPLLLSSHYICVAPGKVESHLDKRGILNSLRVKKRVFFEPRNATAVEATLEEFSAACLAGNNDQRSITNTGGLLFSVCGGKMSEGINFGDELGR